MPLKVLKDVCVCVCVCVCTSVTSVHDHTPLGEVMCVCVRVCNTSHTPQGAVRGDGR